MSTAVPLSVIFHLLACAYRQRASSRRCHSVLKSLVRHAYIPIIVSAPGTRQQRANRMTLKYLSPASLRRIKFGVRGNSQPSSFTLCGRVRACEQKTHTHISPTHTYTLAVSSFSRLCRLRQTTHVPSCSVEYWRRSGRKGFDWDNKGWWAGS